MEAGAMVRKINAQIRYYMHLDPDSLSDDEWAMVIRDLEWIREMEKKANNV
jgi:hypothetical protein